MNPTLKDLRERTKRACHAVRLATDLWGDPYWKGLTMRQAWEENAKIIAPFLAMPDTRCVIPDFRLAFHLEGEIYYHAKEHGLKSALLLKLSRS